MTLDEKKRAAKAFVRFHEATLNLEQILTNLLTYIETFIEQRNSKIYTVHLESRVTKNLGGASSEFVKSIAELGEVLYFFDPALASLFARISIMKEGLLQNVYFFFAQSVQEEVESEYYRTIHAKTNLGKNENIPIAKFNPKREANSFSGIEYTIPAKNLMELDFVEHFYQLLSHYKDRKYWGDFHDFQDSVMTIIKSNLEGGYIDSKDKDKLIELYPKLKAHKELLTQAREKLREFIQKQFSIADIIYVTK